MKKVFLTTALCSVLALGMVPAGFAASPDQTPAVSISKTSVNNDVTAKKLTEEAQDRLIDDAIAALEKTNQALTALQKQDKDTALSALAEAIGKLELVTTAKPELAFAPIKIQGRLYDLFADPKVVDETRRRAVDLLRDGHVPEARALLANLASEVVIETTSIPLGLYPDAIKAVVPLITDDKVDEAITALQATLDTLVVSDVIIPLPILRAEAAIEEAQSLANSDKALSRAEMGKVNDYLDVAQQQLRLTVALGYADRGSLKDLHKSIEDVRKQVKAGKKGTKSFADIVKRMKVKSAIEKKHVNSVSAS